jgi:uncharacterized membrane protein YkvA (DUF1232 family)
MIIDVNAGCGEGLFVTFVEKLKNQSRELKTWVYALYLVCKDPRTPWYARVFAGCVVAYAFSPIDLIPDFIPVLGYVDDLMLVPLGIALTLKMIPRSILDEHRERARIVMAQDKPTNWIAAVVIVIIWIFLAGIVISRVASAFATG